MSTTADLNDYSSRVNITGVTIASIPIDIVAQTIGNITIDIAAVSAGAIAISINVADIIGNLPIDIVAQTVGNITIDIAAASMGSIAVSINVGDIVGNIPIDISAQSMVGNITVDIAAQSMVGNITVDIAAATMGPIAISINVVNIVGNIPIDIAAQTLGNIAIDIAAQTVGNISIDLAANTLGNLTIDIAAQTLGNIAIDVAAQTVDLNIKTSGGVNIIIDKLEQGAFTDRRHVEIWNDNGIVAGAPPNSQTGVAYKGKFFPRGCRGAIGGMQLYCKRTAAGTITLAMSPQPGMGEIRTVTFTPGAAWAWVWNWDKHFWNYDSMFIWVKSCDVDVSYGYDTGTIEDAYTSADSGVTWGYANERYFIRAFMQGLTVGDIPVSGTLNTIALPNAVVGRRGVGLVIPAGATVYDTIQYGSGKVLIIQYVAYSEEAVNNLRLRLRIDGTMALPTDSIMAAWEERRCGESTPGITVGKWDTVNHHYCIVVTLPYPFRRSLEVGFHNSHPTNAQNGIVCYVYGKIS